MAAKDNPRMGSDCFQLNTYRKTSMCYNSFVTLPGIARTKPNSGSASWSLPATGAIAMIVAFQRWRPRLVTAGNGIYRESSKFD